MEAIKHMAPPPHSTAERHVQRGVPPRYLNVMWKEAPLESPGEGPEHHVEGGPSGKLWRGSLSPTGILASGPSVTL